MRAEFRQAQIFTSKKIKALEESNVTQQNTAKTLQEQLDKHTKATKTLQDANTDIQQKLNTSLEENKALQEAHKERQQKLEVALNETKTLQELSKTLQNTCDSLQREKEALQNKLDKSLKEIKTLQGTVETLQQNKGGSNKQEVGEQILFDSISSVTISSDNLEISKTVLGTGAYGRVFKAHYFKTPVAVKQLNEIQLSPSVKKYFRREAEIIRYFTIHHVFLTIKVC